MGTSISEKHTVSTSTLKLELAGSFITVVPPVRLHSIVTADQTTILESVLKKSKKKVSLYIAEKVLLLLLVSLQKAFDITGLTRNTLMLSSTNFKSNRLLIVETN